MNEQQVKVFEAIESKVDSTTNTGVFSLSKLAKEVKMDYNTLKTVIQLLADEGKLLANLSPGKSTTIQVLQKSSNELLANLSPTVRQEDSSERWFSGVSTSTQSEQTLQKRVDALGTKYEQLLKQVKGGAKVDVWNEVQQWCQRLHNFCPVFEEDGFYTTDFITKEVVLKFRDIPTLRSFIDFLYDSARKFNKAKNQNRISTFKQLIKEGISLYQRVSGHQYVAPEKEVSFEEWMEIPAKDKRRK